jgi:hypothetical protein
MRHDWKANQPCNPAEQICVHGRVPGEEHDLDGRPASLCQEAEPLLKENIAWAAETQVGHWMNVIAEWKQMLGADWDKTDAASATQLRARIARIL